MSSLSKSELKKLISQNKTKEVIDILLDKTEALGSKKLQEKVILQSAKFGEYKEDKQSGTVSYDNLNILSSRINKSLIQIVNELPDSNHHVSSTKPINTKSNRLLYLLLAVSVVVIIGVFAMIKYKNDKKTTSTNKDQISNTIFQPKDTTAFNVLIIRFEDYVANKDTYCIGRAIEEHLNVIQANNDLPLSLNTYYADSIPPPNSIQKAKAIQKQHHADLIIYGLAKNVLENCAGAEVCFRYNIGQSVIAQLTPVIDAKTFSHELGYTETSPMAIEKGSLQIDKLSLKRWITSLINIKSNKLEEAFLELDKIGNDTTLTDIGRAKRFNKIGNIYFSLQQYSKALSAYSEAILLTPNNSIFYNNRGGTFFTLKQYPQAMKNFDRAIMIDPNFAMAYNNKGNVYFNLKQYQQAIKDYNKAILLAPNNAMFYNNRGGIFSDLKEYQQAIKDYGKAIRLNPKNAFAYNNRGYAYLKIKELQKSKNSLEQSQQLDSANSWVYRNWACYYAIQKQNSLALQNLENALRLGYDDIEWIKAEESFNAIKHLPKFKELLKTITD